MLISPEKKFSISYFFLLVLACLAVCFVFSPVNASAATIYASSSYAGVESGTESQPYNTFTEAYAAAQAGDTIDAYGTFTWSNAGETGDAGSPTYAGFIISKNLIIQGHGANLTIFQSATTAASASQRIFTVANNISVSIRNATVKNGYYNGGSTYSGGACIYSGTDSVLSLEYLDINNCRLYAAYGGGVRALSTTTISNTSIHDNQYSHSSYGAGVYFSATGKSMIITNSTLYDNFGAWQASSYGSGVYLNAGNLYLTNDTIASNGDWASSGGGIYVNNSASAVLYIQNTIVADNTSNGSTQDNIYKGSAGVIVSGGYNIVGDCTSDSYYTAVAGDWTDTNGDNTYNLYSIGTTGSLSLDTQTAFNDDTHYTYSYGLLSGSIAINNATTTANSGVDIPANDQRGGGRNGITDIGAFEYEASGLTVIEPTTQASAVSFSGVDYKQMTVSWTIGNGQKRAVFIKRDNSGTASPVDGTSYVANSVFGSGGQIGSSGWYCVYDGYGTSTSVTNLAQNTDYIVQVFEHNGVNSGTIDYLTSAGVSNPNVQTTHNPVTYYINYSTGSDSNNGLSSSTPWKTFTKAYASSTGGDTLDLVGTFTWSNADETGDSGSSAYAGFIIAKDLIIQGHGADQTIFQSATTSANASQRIFTVANDIIATIKNATVQNGYYNGGSTYSGGACIYSGTNSNLTLNYLDINNCRLYAAYGGGVRALSTTTISNTSIHDNQYSHSSYGAGVYFSATGKSMTITNSTLYKNFGAWQASSYGSGIYLAAGNMTITNNTIYNNGEWASSGGGIYVANSASAYLYLKNTIVAGNTSSGSTKDNIYKGGSGVVTSNGYNIVGDCTTDSYFTAVAGDWTDTNGDNTYNLYSIGTTGLLGLDSTSTASDNLYYTYTYALTSSSIAINNGTTTANNGISVPNTDQRGMTASSTRDIGAYEYGGVSTVFYTLTYSAGAHGSLTGSTAQSVASGGSGTAVTAVPDSGFSFVNWSDSSTTNPRIDSSVVGNIAVTANFATTTYTLTYLAGNNGTLTGSSTQVILAGGSGTAVTAVPNENYYFSQWSDGSTSNPRTDISVGTSTSVTAVFLSDEENPDTVFVNSVTGNDATGDGTSAHPYKTFNKGYIAVAAGKILDLSGVFTWTDDAETGDAVISGYTISKGITIKGHGPDLTILQAAGYDNTANRRVLTIASGTTATIEDLSIRYGKLTDSTNDGGGIKNNGILTIDDCEIYNNRAMGTYGGGIANWNKLSLERSTVYSNVANYMGGGLVNSYYVTADGYLNITNSTIVYNQVMAVTAYTEGGGIHYRKGSGAITNSTIAYNTACGASGVGMDDPSGVLTIKNSIIAKNIRLNHAYCGNGNGVIDFDFRQAGYGNVVDNGNNIVGYSYRYSWIGNNDWVGATTWSGNLNWNRETFTLHGSSTSGSLNLDHSLALNDNSNKTQTLALLSGSIAINNGATGVNGSISIPNTDQRGSSRVGSGDIGAFEYLGAPEDITPPVILDVTSTVSTSTATITWSTDEESSSQVKYDPSTYLSTRTPVYNSGVKTIGHEIILPNLVACSKYYYAVISQDDAGNISIGDTRSFMTTGCAGSVSVSQISELSFVPAIDNGADVDTTGGTSASTSDFILSQTSNGLTFELVIPRTFAESPATLQLKSLESEPVLNSLSGPSGRSNAGTSVFDIKALSDPASTVSSFESAVAVTLSYSDSDVTGLDEESLVIYRNDGNGWSALSDCEVNTSANTVSCNTNHFSIFGLFGETVAEVAPSPSHTSGSSLFIAPSVPKVIIEPKIINNQITSNVENVYQMAVADNSSFSNSSWESYSVNYDILKFKNRTVYLKYRSPDNGESATYILNATADPSAKSSAPGNFKFNKNLSRGMTSSEVRELQKYLNNNGFKLAKSGPGSLGQETNYFGPLLQKALINFQKAKKIKPANGLFGPATRVKVNAL